MSNDFYSHMPPGGSGKLRALLAQLNDDRFTEATLEKHPLYKEGFTDGKAVAKEQFRILLKTLSTIYELDPDLYGG